jgi:hypothetical protein
MIFSDLPSPAEAGYAKAGNRQPPRIKSGQAFSGSCAELSEHDLFRKPVTTFRDHAQNCLSMICSENR